MLTRMIAFLFSFALGTGALSCQQIVNVVPLRVSVAAQDSCQAVSDPNQLKSLISAKGGPASFTVPQMNWTLHNALITFANTSSTPTASAYSQDGAKVLIKAGSASQSNSGVFLVTISNSLGSQNACAVFRDPATSESNSKQTKTITTHTSTMPPE